MKCTAMYYSSQQKREQNDDESVSIETMNAESCRRQNWGNVKHYVAYKILYNSKAFNSYSSIFGRIECIIQFRE